MTTIDVGVRVNLEESSLRNLQQDLARTVQAISPQLNIDTTEAQRAVQRFFRGGEFSIKIRGIEGQAELNRAINEVLTNRQVKLTGFDPRDLRKLRRQIEEELGKIEIDVAGRGQQRAVRQRERSAGRPTEELSQAISQTTEQIAERRARLIALLEEAARLQAAQNQFAEQAAREQGEIALRLAEASPDLQRFRTEQSALLAAQKKASQSQGQVSTSFEDIAKAVKKRARVEKELFARAQQLLGTRSEEEGISPRGPRIESVEERIGNALQIDANLIRARVELDQETNKRKQKQIALLAQQNTAQDKLTRETTATEQKEINNLRRQEISVLDQQISREKTIGAFTRDTANSQKTLSKILEERVRAAQAAGQLGGIPQEQQSRLSRAAGAAAKAFDSISSLFGRTIDPAAKQFGFAAKRGAESFKRGSLAIANVERQLQLEARTLLGLNRTQKSLQQELQGLEIAISATAVGTNFRRTGELVDKQNAALTKLTNVTGEITKSRERIRDIEIKRASAIERQAQPQRQSTSRGGTARGGRDITFRGAGDIERFGETLNATQLDKFVKVLLGVERAGVRAGKGISRFNLDIQGGTPLVDRLRNRLSAANKEVFNFGVRTSLAARRLLEWATPAQFIFQTIGRLQQAVSTLVQLDTQARRLEFFNRGSGLSVAAQEARTFNDQITASRANLSAFLQVARQVGLEASQIAEAFVTAARVGVDLNKTLTAISMGQTELQRGFAQTVIQLVRLEAGALSAEQAVRKLRAIQAQFIDTLGLSASETEAAVANIGALLATAAAKSSFNVNELSNAVARLGTSFANLQGVNIPATIGIIATAARVTGAEVGRLSTTFRQLTTLTVQNADVLRDAFNIQVIDPDTGRQSFQGILNFLQEVNRLQQVDATRAGQLAKLGTDRRNINEVKQLAAAVGQLQKQFGDLTTTEAQVAIAAESAVAAFRAEQNLAAGLEASFKRLTNEFSILAETFVATDLFQSFVSGAASAIGAVTSIIESVQKVKPVFAVLASFIAATVAPKIVAALAGAGAALLDAFSGAGARTQIQQQVQQLETSVEGVNAARKEGLITTAQQRTFNEQITRQLGQQKVIEDQIVAVKRRIQDAEVAALRDETAIRNLKREQLTLERQLSAEVQRGNTQRTKTAAIIGDQRAGIFSPSRIAAVGAIAVGVGVLVASKIGDGIRSGGGSKALAKGIESGLTGALVGGLIGAQVGSLILPGIGTVVGAGIGALGAGLFAGITSARKEQDKLAKESKIQQKSEEVRLSAISAQRRIILAQQARETAFAGERTKSEARILKLVQKIRLVQNDLQKAGKDINLRAATLEKLTRLQVRLEKSKGDLQKEQLAIQARQIAFASQIAILRRSEQEELARIAVLREASLVGLEQERVIPIRLEFNRIEVLTRIKRIRAEIEAELRRQGTIELQTDVKAFEQSRQRVLSLQTEERRLGFSQTLKEIQLRKQLQDRQSTLFSDQIQKLTQANDKFAQALQGAFQSQLKIAETILSAGNIAARVLADRGQDFLRELEARGAGVSTRLRALQRQADRELAQLQRNQAVAEQVLGATGVRSFQGASDIEKAFAATAKALRAAGANTAKEIFNQLKAEFDVDLLVQRERARLSRQDFNQRIQQTRTELQIRGQILNQEVQLLKQRIGAERELRNLRVDQQREFGRLLLQGPEEFNKVIDSIRGATNFFKNVGDLDVNNLQRIADRAVQLRATGRFDILQSVQRGLQNLISTGGARIVGAATNEELLRVFEQIVTSGLPGGTTPEEVSLQLERVREEAARQTKEQETLRKRQEELQRIAIQQVKLQEVEARIAAEAALISARQRDLLIVSAQKRFLELQEIKRALQNITRQGIRISAFGAPIPVISAGGRPTAGGPIISGATPVPRGATGVSGTLLRALQSLSPDLRAAVEKGFKARGVAIPVSSDFATILAKDLAKLNVLQFRKEVGEIQKKGGKPEEQREQVQAARRRAAQRLNVLRTADIGDTDVDQILDGFADIIERAAEGGPTTIASLESVLPDFNKFISEILIAGSASKKFAEAQEIATRRQQFQIRLQEIIAKNRRVRFALLTKQIRQRNKLLRLDSREESVKRLAIQLRKQQNTELTEFRTASQAAIATLRKQFPDVINSLTTSIRKTLTGFNLLEVELTKNVAAERARREEVAKFRELGLGLRPPGFRDELPGVRQNQAIDKVLKDFFSGLSQDPQGNFQIVPRELKLIREAIQKQGGQATPRQQRRVRVLERERVGLGRRFAGQRGAEFFLRGRRRRAPLPQDPRFRRQAIEERGREERRRRGVELGFRELLQGDTPLIRQLREITQTERGARVTFRGRKELDIPQFKKVLEDAGLSGIAASIEGRRDAAKVANQLLKLSASFQKQQGPLNRVQIRQLAEILGREFRSAFEREDATNRREAQRASRAVRRRPGESEKDFQERRTGAEERGFARAIKDAAESINTEVFKESASAIGKEIGAEVAKSQLDASKLITDQLKKLEELRVTFQDRLKIDVQANINKTIQIDQAFVDTLRELFPDIDDAQLQALLKTVGALARIERGRGTPLPLEANELIGD